MCQLCTIAKRISARQQQAQAAKQEAAALLNTSQFSAAVKAVNNTSISSTNRKD